MKATEESKRQAYNTGYALFQNSGKTYAEKREAFNAYNTNHYFPVEAWSFVKGFEQATKDWRNR